MNESADSVKFYAHAMGMTPILAVGFLGNVLNLVTLSRGSGLRGITFTYLQSVAVADLGAVLGLLPFLLQTTIGPFQGEVGWMWYQAHVCVPLINAFMAANSFSIVALTIERFLSICYPIFAHRLKASARHRARQVICTVWIVSFLFYAPQCLQKKLSGNATLGYSVQRRSAFEVSRVFGAYLIAREVLCRQVPILVLILLNTRIIVGFRARAKSHRALVSNGNSFADPPSSLSLPQHRHSNAGQRERGRDRFDAEWSVYLLLIVTVVAFVLCNLPASLLSLYVASRPPKESNISFQTFRAVANLLEVAGHASNFYLYCLCSSDYRCAFRKLVGLAKGASPSIPVTPSAARFSTVGTAESAVGLLPLRNRTSSEAYSLFTTTPTEERISPL